MHKIIVILSISAFSWLAVNLNPSGSSQRKTQAHEDFFVFFQVFCLDSTFQVNRIKFPLIETYLSANLDTVITRKIVQSAWTFLPIKESKTNTFEYYFSSFTDRKLPDTNEMVYSIIGIENGIQVNYYFKRENEKWFLVKIEDLST